MTRTAAQLACLSAAHTGDVPPELVVRTITTLVELEQYRIAMRLAGRLDEAAHAIAVRQRELQKVGARG